MGIKINQREYAWGDINILLFGQPVFGARGIEYTPAQEKEALTAQGYNPHGIQRGQRSYSGTLTILRSELEALNRSAKAKGYKDLLDVDFDIIVSYSTDGLAVSIDRIRFASITEIPQTFSQGDKFQEVALKFIALDIEQGVDL